MDNNIICGTVTSFSEFAMLEAAFHFVGFLSPLENPPVVNSVKAGQSVPLKFQLIDDNGGYLSNLDAVTGIWLQQVECTNSQLNNDVYTTNTSGDSGLHYDTETNQFIYTWKTKKNIPDCSRIILELYNSFLQEVYFEKK